MTWSMAARQAAAAARRNRHKPPAYMKNQMRISDSGGNDYMDSALKHVKNMKNSEGVPSNMYDYVYRHLHTKNVKPSQHGEDYDNASSRDLAERLKSEHSYIAKHNDIDYDGSMRREDHRPIVTDKHGNIIDGNHRHAAHVIAGVKRIHALVQVGPGTGKVLNK